MAKLPKEVRESIEKAILKEEAFPVATASNDSTANVAYITYLKPIDDETILIADNFLNKTRDNILANSKVSFVVLDEKKGSYQIKGSAKRLTEGEMFEHVQDWVVNELPRVAAIVMKVEEVYNGAEKIC